MNAWAEIAELSRNPTDGGGYSMELPNGSLHVSDKGLREMIHQLQLMEKFRPALDAFESQLHVWCADHGRPLTDEEGEPFSWNINDYAPWGSDVRSPVFMLYGWHQFSGEFCIAAWARGTLDGSLIACVGDWRAQ
jgi:hypothetical protein